MSQILLTPKDKLNPLSEGAYAIPCSCIAAYTGETDRLAEIRPGEH